MEEQSFKKILGGVAQQEDVSPGASRLVQTCELEFRTLQDLDTLISFIRALLGYDKKILDGIHAVCLNAIEHGNLQIGYEFKAELLAENLWEEEIHKRLNHPENKNKKAKLVLTKKDGGFYFIVTDQGQGFDWQKYLNIDPGRAGQKHGRGIAVANAMSFDKLSYNDVGNQVIAFVSGGKKFAW